MLVIGRMYGKFSATRQMRGLSSSDHGCFCCFTYLGWKYEAYCSNLALIRIINAG